jgi:ATP-dependent Lon protease
MEQVTLKIFFLKRKIIFPYCTLAVFVKPTEDSKEIRKGDRILAVSVRSTIDMAWRRERLATLSEVVDTEQEGGSIKITLRGLERVTVTKFINYRSAEFLTLSPRAADPHDGTNETLRKKAQELVFLINVEESDKLIKLLNYIVDLNQMTDFIANYFVMDFPARYRLYRETDIANRSMMLTVELTNLITRLTKKRNKNTV